MAEIKCLQFFAIGSNLVRGFYPSATKSFNTVCERKAFGMGPTDHHWSRWIAYVHRGPAGCGNNGCPDCEEVVLHQCGEMICPDVSYIFEHGIDYYQMYTDPVHKMNSHLIPAGMSG